MPAIAAKAKKKQQISKNKTQKQQKIHFFNLEFFRG